MRVLVLTIRLHANWIHSLKEKRMEIKSIIGKLKNKFEISVAEIDEQDTHQIMVIGAVSIVFSEAQADSMVDKIISFVYDITEALVTEYEYSVVQD